MNLQRTLGIVLFSIIEVAGLAGWLVLADAGQVVVGILVLALGLIVEHIVTDNLLHKRPLYNLGSLPFGQIVAFSTLADRDLGGLVGAVGYSSSTRDGVSLLCLGR